MNPNLPIQSAFSRTVHIWDLAPTTLHLFRIPIPNDIDGKPISIY